MATTDRDKITSPDGLSICSRMPGVAVWGCTRYEESWGETELIGQFFPDTGQTAEEILERFERERQHAP